MEHQEYWINNSSGDALYYQSWRTPNPPRAVICIVHGYAEHSTRYAPIADFFNQNGYSVYTYDRYGHGRSPGKRGHSRSYDHMLEEISLLLDLAKSENPGVPIILYGHSQGGNLALNYLCQNNSDISGALITGPWIYLGNTPPKWQEKLLRILARFLPKLSVPTNLESKYISNDVHEVEKYVNDPLVFSTITLNTGKIMLDAADNLKRKQQSDIPILIMHGAEDKICLPKGTKEFEQNFTGNLGIKFVPGGFHEIHHDVNKDEIYSNYREWIERCISK